MILAAVAKVLGTVRAFYRPRGAERARGAGQSPPNGGFFGVGEMQNKTQQPGAKGPTLLPVSEKRTP
jgi:hypothetical protein